MKTNKQEGKIMTYTIKKQIKNLPKNLQVQANFILKLDDNSVNSELYKKITSHFFKKFNEYMQIEHPEKYNYIVEYITIDYISCIYR
jgi:ubiquitin C-terminal hydrolase